MSIQKLEFFTSRLTVEAYIHNKKATFWSIWLFGLKDLVKKFHSQNRQAPQFCEERDRTETNDYIHTDLRGGALTATLQNFQLDLDVH